jgi:hypothetical protein
MLCAFRTATKLARTERVKAEKLRIDTETAMIHGMLRRTEELAILKVRAIVSGSLVAAKRQS